MASCATTKTPDTSKRTARSKEYFSEKEYGVKASPRVVADGRPVPKGGGRYLVGDPYQVKGKTYVPKEDTRYNKSGLASWYGSAFHGRLTANGEVYDSASVTAAHPTFPLPSYARVTNLDNGSSMIVRVNDRGPYHPGRIIDVSEKTAQLLDIKRVGTANVNVQYVGRARMDGQDTPFLMASYVRKGDRLPGIRPEGQIATGVMVASNRPLGDDLQSYGSALPRQTAYAGRTPSAPTPAAPARSKAYQALDRTATLQQATPRPGDRPLAHEARQPARAVAAAYPAERQRPELQRPEMQRAEIQKAQPQRIEPVQQVRQPEQATRPQPQMTAGLHPVQPQARQPQPQAQMTATAYAGDQRAREPVVMFGNMVLQNPAR